MLLVLRREFVPFLVLSLSLSLFWLGVVCYLDGVVVVGVGVSLVLVPIDLGDRRARLRSRRIELKLP